MAGLFVVELLCDALLRSHFLSCENPLMGQHRVLVAVLLCGEAMVYLKGVFNLLGVFPRVGTSLALFHVTQIQVEGVLDLVAVDFRVFVNFGEKFLRMGPDLSRRSCTDMIFNGLPIFTEGADGINKSFVLILGPPARGQLALCLLALLKIARAGLMPGAITGVRHAPK